MTPRLVSEGGDSAAGNNCLVETTPPTTLSINRPRREVLKVCSDGAGHRHSARKQSETDEHDEHHHDRRASRCITGKAAGITHSNPLGRLRMRQRPTTWSRDVTQRVCTCQHYGPRNRIIRCSAVRTLAFNPLARAGHPCGEPEPLQHGRSAKLRWNARCQRHANGTRGRCTRRDGGRLAGRPLSARAQDMVVRALEGPLLPKHAASPLTCISWTSPWASEQVLNQFGRTQRTLAAESTRAQTTTLQAMAVGSAGGSSPVVDNGCLHDRPGASWHGAAC